MCAWCMWGLHFYTNYTASGGQGRNPAFISLGVDISPSTGTLNFLPSKNQIISLTKRKKCNFADLYNHRRHVV
jgi:hypothetical protein